MSEPAGSDLPGPGVPGPDVPKSDGPMVVGIGASAGGLAALRTLFADMPPDTGLSFVVVVHLSPDHESHLADLLQPHCDMPVEQVQETIAVEPDHVYVIPPGRNLDTIDSHLRLSELEDRALQRAPIDHFFRTLSHTHDSRAIGIVLTGTGSDGTTGLEYIRGRGGLTIVQDPDEAEFDGMPRNAISSGCVDRVLALDQIAEHVVGYAKTDPQLVIPEDDDELSEDAERALQRILSQVRARTGHDMTGYKRSTMLRRLRRRMQLHRRQHIDDYLELVREDPEEARLLFDDLLISVTSFFRDPEVFEHLEQVVIPDLLRDKQPDDTVRVWSAGCSTGEEAYSLAILLIEAAERMDRPPVIQVFATDLHEFSLQRAREGFYPEAIEADMPPERLRRFFTAGANGYRLNKEVREMVVFAPHNVLRDPPFSHLDLVSCRNMLIYVNREVQRSIIDLFHYALEPGGYLVLGSSETIDRSELFVPVHKAFCLFQRRDVAAPAPKLPVFVPAPRPRPLGPSFTAVSPTTNQGFGGLHEKMVERFAPPSVLVNEDLHILHYSMHAGEYLVHPGGEPTNDLLRLVREELRIELRAAMYATKEQSRPATSKPVRVTIGDTERRVVVRVRPASDDDGLDGLYLVIFDDVENPVVPAPGDEHPPDAATVELEDERDLLKQHLQALIEQYETTQEEMRASNEEMQSTNEELRSTLEELETSKEELQSVNEELTTVNQENRHKVEELRLLSSDLQNLLVGTDIATLFLDRHLRILRFTPQVEQLFNIRSSDRGRPLSDLTHQLGYAEILDDASKVLDRLTPIEREVESHDQRWFLTRVLPYRTTDDRIEGVVITFVDITRRQEAEHALRESEARLRLALEASRMGAWAWDLATDTFIPDARTSELLRSAISDASDFESAIARVVADDRGALLRAVGDAARRGQRFDVEVRVDGPGGATSWLIVSGQGYSSGHDGHADITRLAGTVLDITDRKETEQSLSRRVDEQTRTIRQSERRFRALVEASTQIVWSTDDNGLVVEDSSAWRDYTGQDFTQFRGAGWLEAIHPDDRGGVEEAWRAAVADHDELDVEFRLHHAPSQRWRWVSARSVPMRDVGDPLFGWVGMITDIDERKRADEQIRALASNLTMAEHEERRRIARVLHDDLQQRLYSLQMKAGLLRGRLAEPADDVALADIETQLSASVDLTRNLTVDLSPPILEGEGLADALCWLATQMGEMHGLHVDVRAAESCPIADEDMRVFLFQIVRELLFNVVKHAGVDRARVDLTQEDGILHIAVVDHGSGFPADAVARSSGLGLTSATERLSLFGGSIHIESEPTDGTAVRVAIPNPEPA